MTLSKKRQRREQEFYKSLRHGGKWLYRHKLIFYDELFDEIDFSWKYWHILEKIVCKFKGHKPEQFYRLPKEDETPSLIDKMGCVKDNIMCLRCFVVIK